MAEGWAVKDSIGRILINTVSETRRAAIVNWLCVVAKVLVTNSTSDAAIELQWEQLRGNNEVVRVRVDFSP